MDKKQSPIEIARQTLMQLAARKTQPTPDNFRSVYDEIAGVKSVDSSQELGKTLNKVLQDAGHKSPKYRVVAQAIPPLLEQKDWAKLEEQLRKLFPASQQGSEVAAEVNWSLLIRSLVKQLETSHKGVTLTRKKEGLSRVLTNFASDPDVLGQKIQALISSWGMGTAPDAQEHASAAAPQIADLNTIEGSATTVLEAKPLAIEDNQLGQAKEGQVRDSQNRDSQVKFEVHWREMLLRTFELVLIPYLEPVPDSEKRAKALLAQMKQHSNDQAVARYAEELKPLLLTLEMQRDQQQRIHQSLLELLKLIVASMGELVMEDKWLHGQTMMISDVISKPINLNTLYDAESSLKELVYKQSHIKPALTEAKDTLKKMVTTFVDRLVEMTESTSDYHVKIENYQKKLTSTEDIGELNSLLTNILEDTRTIGVSVQRTRDDFTASQKKAAEAEQRVQELTAELDHISDVAHQDYLTGALNRRGMDEALEREFSRADRHGTTLCIAMMDIDHFKKLNDNLGHATGDQALVHFVNIIKKVLRTTDVLARFGGEEFIIILPVTPQQEAIRVITRVQRELTKNFFMNRNERVLITFSAGVAERKPGESPESLIPRADAALYQAKNTGRNQVIGAETLLES